MALTSAQLAQLKTELQTDPQSLGFSALTPTFEFNQCAILLNQGGVTLTRTSIDSGSLQKAVEWSEWETRSAIQRDGWLAILSLGGVEIRDAILRAQVSGIWSGATTTTARLQALQTRDGSRAEELFGDGVRVTGTECRKAWSS